LFGWDRAEPDRLSTLGDSHRAKPTSRNRLGRVPAGKLDIAVHAMFSP